MRGRRGSVRRRGRWSGVSEAVMWRSRGPPRRAGIGTSLSLSLGRGDGDTVFTPRPSLSRPARWVRTSLPARWIRVQCRARLHGVGRPPYPDGLTDIPPQSRGRGWRQPHHHHCAPCWLLSVRVWQPYPPYDSLYGHCYPRCR